MLRGQKLNPVRSIVMLSPQKPFDQIQPNLACELLSCLERAAAKSYLALPPGALGRGKESNIIYFQLQSQFQRFVYQTLCEFSQLKDTVS